MIITNVENQCIKEFERIYKKWINTRGIYESPFRFLESLRKIHTNKIKTRINDSLLACLLEQEEIFSEIFSEFYPLISNGFRYMLEARQIDK